MAAIIYIIFGIVELLLGLRFVFYLFGANSLTPVVEWVYNLSAPLVAPFTGIFGQPQIGGGVHIRAVFDPATLAALVVYGIIGGILMQLFVRPRPTYV